MALCGCAGGSTEVSFEPGMKIVGILDSVTSEMQGHVSKVNQPFWL